MEDEQGLERLTPAELDRLAIAFGEALGRGPDALDAQAMRAVPLGTLVLRAGLLPEREIEDALHESVGSGRRLGEVLVRRGLLSEEDIARLLEGQRSVPEGSARPGELGIRRVCKDGLPVVTLRHLERGSDSVVECEVYPVDRLLVEPINQGPRVFSSIVEASAFVEATVTALQYLGCELVPLAA